MINPSVVISNALYEQVPLHCKGQANALVQEINLVAGSHLKSRKVHHVVKGTTYTTALIMSNYLFIYENLHKSFSRLGRAMDSNFLFCSLFYFSLNPYE